MRVKKLRLILLVKFAKYDHSNRSFNYYAKFIGCSEKTTLQAIRTVDGTGGAGGLVW